MTVWFIADTHFGRQPRHRIKSLGMTGSELDDRIAARWACMVGDGDEVWHLGDVGPDIDRLAGLPGIKHLIRGNDDLPLKALAGSAVFKSVQNQHLLQMEGQAFFLVHKPSDVPSNPGGHVVHGHTHQLEPAAGLRSVSVDRTDWGPITLATLLEMTA